MRKVATMDFNRYYQHSAREAGSPRPGRARAGLPAQWLNVGALALAIAFAMAIPARGADSTVDPNVPKLEMKLFKHEYPKDDVESRLDRLEKMIFGESKDGAFPDRIKNLLTAVPNVDSKPDSDEESADGTRGAGGNEAQPSGSTRNGGNAGKVAGNEPPPTDRSKYPAVAAIENRLFGKDFAGEPVAKRLERLETKVFGHVSGIDDLSERVDRLKQRTGIDIAKQAPLGTDWADDEEDFGAPTTSMGSPYSGGGEDGRSFSGRDLRKEMGIPGSGLTDRWAGTGSYGMGSAAAPPPRRPPVAQGGDDMPPQAVPGMPNYLPPAQGGNQALGLNQQVGALEQEIFGKTYVRDALSARLSRLESTVFPQQKPSVEGSLPDRVSRLLSVVPLSKGAQPQRSIAQTGGRSKQVDPDFGDLDDLTNMQSSQGGQPRPGSGLSKIINSIGSFLSGGYTGGYPMAPNGVVTDPQTGLWFDPRTGSLIDPITGAVVGQRAMQQPGVGSSMNGFGSFGNGFAPYGSAPYGTGYGTGMHFGFGGIGRYGYGMWP